MAGWDEKIDACYDGLTKLVRKFIAAGEDDDPLVIEAKAALRKNEEWLAEDEDD